MAFCVKSLKTELGRFPRVLFVRVEQHVELLIHHSSRCDDSVLLIVHLTVNRTFDSNNSFQVFQQDHLCH